MSASRNLVSATALNLGDAVRARQVSPVEVAQASLALAETLDERYGMFVTRTPERALEQARAVEARVLGADDPAHLPPLIGVPCPVKDLNPVAGVRLTFGSAAFTEQVAEVDDGVVTLLARAGTLMTGKTNTPELGLPCYTEPDVAPPARTPWDQTRSAGGSSGGAAAVVAAGVAPIAQGSDGGGSIRIPASVCGLVGLKPTRGRVSPGPHGVDVAGFAVTGPLARTVADAAALLDVMSPSWPGDVTALPGPATTFIDAARRDPPRLRVGVLTDPVIAADAPVHPACRKAAEDTARVLADLGHHVEPVGVPFPAERWGAFSVLWAALAASAPVPPEREALLRPLTRWLREQGRSVSAVDYVSAIAGTQQLAREVARAWSDYDVVLSPTLADLPARVGALRDDDDPAADFSAQTRFTPWTSVWNLIGRPAISLPLGWHDDRGTTLPVGVMLGAPFGADELLLSLSGELEQAMSWFHRYEPMWATLESA
jgi:amidase